MSVVNFPEGWNYRTEIVLSAGSLLSGNVTNHIQKLKFSCLSLGSLNDDIFTGEKRADHFAEDIVFSLDSAGATILDWHIQYFSQSEKEVWIDVRIPTYTTTTFSIYMWRSKWKETLLARTDTYGSDDVWVDYARVVHLNEEAGGPNPTDWSPNDTSCQYKADLPKSDSGETIWGTAPCFRPQTTTGGGDRVGLNTNLLQPDIVDSFGCGGWFAPYDFGDNRYVWGKRNGTSGVGWCLRLMTDGKLRFICDTGTAYSIQTDSSVITTADTWYHIWVTYDGSKNASGMKIYVNGVLVASSVYFGTFPISGSPSNGVYFAVGGIESNDNTETFRGGYQEFRYVRDEVKSADYIKLMYETQNNLETYATPETAVFVGKTVANDWDVSDRWSVNTRPSNIPSTESNFAGKLDSNLIPASLLSIIDVNKLRVTSNASGTVEIPFYVETVEPFSIWFLITDLNDTTSKTYFFWPTLKVDTDEKQPIPTRDTGAEKLNSSHGTLRMFSPLDEQTGATVCLNLSQYDDSRGTFLNTLPHPLTMDTPAQEFFAINNEAIEFPDQIGGLGDNGDIYKNPFSLSFKTFVLDPTVDYAFMAMVEMTNFKGFSVRVSRDASTNKNIFFVLRAGSNPNNAIIVHGNTTLSAFGEVHVAIEWDGTQSASNVKMYVDGVLQTLTIINDTLPTATPTLTIPFTLGIRGTDRELEGGLDSAKFFSNKNFGGNWYYLENLNYSDPQQLFEIGVVGKIAERHFKRGAIRGIKRGTANG